MLLPAYKTMMPFGHSLAQVTEVIERYARTILVNGGNLNPWVKALGGVADPPLTPLIRVEGFHILEQRHSKKVSDFSRAAIAVFLVKVGCAF